MPVTHVVALAQLAFVAAAACSEGTRDSSQAKKCDGLAPRNPYSKGSGHFAGFEWASGNAGSGCDGNSDSFNEGCQDYHRQRAKYNACVAKN